MHTKRQTGTATKTVYAVDFKEIKGQEAVKRALTIALAGGHTVAVFGPSGHGKTMLVEAARGVDATFKAYEVTFEPRAHERTAHLTRMAKLARVADIHVEVPALPFRELAAKRYGTDSETIRGQVGRAKRFAEVKRDADLSDACLALAKAAYDELGLNPRAFAAVVRVARTIANLDGTDRVGENHLAEAVQYRLLDRKF